MTSSTPTPAHEPVDLLDGRWRVERRLSGQFGTVLILVDHDTGVRHAAKTPRVDLRLDEAMRARFEAEARNWMALGHHENVVEAFFLEELSYAGERRPFLFLEFVDGPTLEDALRAEGRLAESVVLDVATGIAWGLAHAHGSGRPGTALVHRDLKPENVFLTRDRVVKVSDFGIARAMDGPDEVAAEDSGVGTPYYAAPEQMRDARLADRRSDVYSFGALLHELLTGSPPFPAGSLSELVLRVLREPPPSVREARPDVSEELAGLILACLQKDPDQRPASFDVVLQSLSALRENDRIWLPDEATKSCAVCGWSSATGRDVCSICGATMGEGRRHAPVSRRSDRSEPTLGRRRGTSKLVIEGVELRPRRPRVGERVIVTLQLGNPGAEAVQKVVVPFGLPDPDTFALLEPAGRRAYRGTVPPTAPGAPLRVSWSIVPLREGSIRVRGPRAYYADESGQRQAVRSPDLVIDVGARDAIPLVGRDGELASLGADADAVLPGRSRLTVIVGRPGSGKSRLAREAVDLATKRGFRTARGRCLDRGVEARGALKEALRQLCDLTSEHAGPAEVAARLLDLLDPDAAGTRALVSSLVDELLGGDRASRESPAVLWSRLAVAMAREGPLLLVLEDVQRDREVAQIARLAAEAAGRDQVPLWIVLTARPQLERGAGRELLDPTRRDDGATTVLRVRPLDHDQAHALLERQFTPNDFETSAPWLFSELRKLSGGNALFLLELVELLRAGRGRAKGLLVTEAGRWTAGHDLTPEALAILVPDRVESVVLARLDELDADARTLLDAAAIGGDIVSTSVLRRVLDDPDWFDEAVSRLETAGILRESGDARSRLRFREPLLPEVVNRRLTRERPDEARRLHAVYGEILAPSGHAHPANALRAARHLVRAQQPRVGFRLLLAAAERLLRRQSFRRVAAVLDEAAAVLVGGHEPAPDERVRFELLVGEASRRVGEFQAALAAYARLVGEDALPAVSEADQAEAHDRLGRVHAALGNFDAAARHLSLALGAWQDLDRHEAHVLVLVDIAALYVLRGDGARARTYLERAERVAMEGDTPAARSRAEIVRARLELLLGHPERGRAPLREALSAARSIRDRNSAATARHALGMAQLREGRLRPARRSFERALALHQRTGDRAACAATWIALGATELAAGMVEIARDRFTRGLEMGREMDLPRLIVDALGGLVRTALAAGRPRRALKRAEELERVELDRAERSGRCSALVAAAGAYAATGDRRRAAHLLSRAQSLAETCDDQQILALVALARAEHSVSVGRPEIALRRASRGLQRPGISPDVRVALLAIVAEQSQDVEAAREAVALATRLGTPHTRARALAARGRVALAAGDGEAAARLLRRAVGQILDPDAVDPLLHELLLEQARALTESDPAGAEAAGRRAATMGAELAARGYVGAAIPSAEVVERTPADGVSD